MNQVNPCGVRNHFAALHEHFLAILPRVELHGRIYFRHLRQDDKDEAMQEMRALAWQWFLRLHARGKDPCEFMHAFTTLLARAVNSGRRLVGMAKGKDALNKATQRRHGFKVESLSRSARVRHEQLYAAPSGQRLRDAYEDQLRDNTVTPVLDQVQFRLDWPAWLGTLTGRERRMIRAMASGERTLDIGKQFELSPARISQLRREFRDDWRNFCGDENEGAAVSVQNRERVRR